jgi:hypothetical protein
MATISQAREIVAKNPDNYKRFETYETRRQDKKAWGEVLEQFLRTRGSAAPRPLASATRLPACPPPASARACSCGRRRRWPWPCSGRCPRLTPLLHAGGMTWNPVVAGKELDLYVLYHEVCKQGGVEAVVKSKRWKRVCCLPSPRARPRLRRR